MIVQGDVFFVRIAEKDIPAKAKLREKSDRGFVIAEGEATGHAHAIEDEVELYEADGVLYLKTPRTVEVKHEEHHPVVLKRGSYKIGKVREYDPLAKQMLHVKD